MVDAHVPVYEIRLQGQLDQRWSDWFSGLAVSVDDGVTTLIGPVIDQAVLRGILSKIWDLNLVLISVNPIDM